MAAKRRVLVVTNDDSVSLDVVSSAMSATTLGSGPDDQFVVLTQAASHGGKFLLEDVSFDVAILVSRTSEFVEQTWVDEITRLLKPGGVVLFQVIADQTSNQLNAAVERSVLMAGFVDIQVVKAVPIVPLREAQCTTVQGKKPSWNIGSSFALKKSIKVVPNIQVDDDFDLIDEDSLLTEDDLKKPQPPTVGDCEVGKTRKACKNCTCGRAEEEAKVLKLDLTEEQINNPQSACGSCGLGDAFRCGTCPYRGLPPFKPGEKVTISADFLAADI